MYVLIFAICVQGFACGAYKLEGVWYDTAEECKEQAIGFAEEIGRVATEEKWPPFGMSVDCVKARTYST